MTASIRGFFLAALLMLAVIGLFSRQNAPNGKAKADLVSNDRKDYSFALNPGRGPDSTTSSEAGKEFSLFLEGSGHAEYCLVIGCLNGELQGNRIQIESRLSSDKPDVVKTIGIPVRTLKPSGKTYSSSELISSFDQTLPQVAFAFTPNSTQRKGFSLFGGEGRMNDSEAYHQVSAVCLAESDHLRIWYDEQDSHYLDENLMRAQVTRLINTYETLVVPRLIPWLGQVADVDRDGKFSILMTSRLDQLQKNSTRLDGLTWGGDFHSGLEAPFTNKSDMIYMNPSNPDLNSVSAILLHEYVHAISFSHRCRGEQTKPEQKVVYEEDWLNEGISHVVETRLGGNYSNIDYRLSEFEAAPNQYPLIVPNYYRAQMWRNDGCRGAIFSFLDWCVDQEGEQLIPQLLQSSQTGVKNLEAATRKRFESMFSQWSVSQINKKARKESLSAGDELNWEQAGTSVKYLRLSARQAGHYRFRIESPPQVRLQLAVVPLLKTDFNKD